MTTRRRRIAKRIAVVLLLLIALFVAFPGRPFFFPKHYDVVSIARAPEYKDPARLERARQNGPTFAPLFFQTNGSVCGPTSLANVFHSLGEDASVETVLAGTGKCWTGVCMGGLTLDELAEIARHRPGHQATILRDLTVDALRAELAQLNDPKRRYIVNFDRGPLFGTQGGHHSPIGGYLPADDLVLVLDVNKKYEPWLVSTSRLHAAIDTIDASSEKKRGLLVVSIP